VSFRTLLPLALVSVVALVAAQVGTARTGSACKPSTTPLATATQTFAARVTTATHAFHKPGKGAFLALPVSDPYGFPTTLSILDRYG